MNNPKKYDYNVYVVDGYITLTAYRQQHVITAMGERFMEGDYAKSITLKMPMTVQYFDEIAYLLHFDQWNKVDWEEYDDWLPDEYLTYESAPKAIFDWVCLLPNYDIPTIDYRKTTKESI